VLTDSKERGIRLGRWKKILVAGLCPLSILFYVVATRGYRGGLAALVNIVGFWVTPFISYLWTFYALWLLGLDSLIDPACFATE